MVFNEMNRNNPELERFSIGEFGTGMSYTRYTYSDLTLSDTIITYEDQLKVTIKVKNTGSREGKETVLWYLADEVGTYSRPVKQLRHFEKQFLLPGEVKEYAFTIDPQIHLAYPAKDGKKLLEDGYFKVIVGPFESKFKLVEDK
jgi:beta-glucosidase